jgi:hypothetical protein
MKHKSVIILGIMFAVILALRLFVAFQTTEVTYDAYFALRNVENIKETGLPLFKDDLSYSGRNNVFSPLYYYILAIFSLILPEMIVLKLIPNILATSLILIVYLFANHLSKNEDAALISAGASAVIPVFFSNTINNASIYTLVIPLFFLSTYYFLKTVSDSKNLWKLITCLILLTISHASSLILAFCLLIYVALLKIQGFKQSSKEPELLLFALFLIVWANLTIYQQAITMHGTAAIYQNMPIQLILEIYKELTFVESMYWIGVIPLLFGVITIYDSVFSSRKKSVSVLIAICLTFFILLWFKLINIYVGLMFLGVSMSILASGTIGKLLIYAENLKFKVTKPLTKTIIILLIIISFLPAIAFSFIEASKVPSKQDIEAFEWIRENTNENTTILALPQESTAMSYYTQRKNVMDENFLLIQNINLRYDETRKIYTDRFLIQALTKLNYYSVDYILLSENAKNQNKTELFYEDRDCIEKEYTTTQTGPEIFSVNCVVVLRE